MIYPSATYEVRKQPPIALPRSLPALCLDLQCLEVRDANEEILARFAQDAAQATREFRILLLKVNAATDHDLQFAIAVARNGGAPFPNALQRLPLADHPQIRTGNAQRRHRA